MRRFAVTLLVLWLSPLALADEPKLQTGPIANAVEVSTEKLNAEFLKGFAAADLDDDGKLDLAATVKILKSLGFGSDSASAAEAPQRGRRGRGGGAEDRFKANDRNGDGKLTKDEINNILKQHPEADDSEVTLEEFKHIWEEMFGGANGGNRGRGGAAGGGRPQGLGGRGGAGGRRGGTGSGRFGGLRSTDVEFFASLDSNRDRLIDRSEVRKAIEKDLEVSAQARGQLDTNGDGRVTAKEYALSMPQTGSSKPSGDQLDGHTRGHFNREDLDGDGVISAEEIVKHVVTQAAPRVRALVLSLKLGAEADSNGDKVVTKEELAAVLDQPWKQVLQIPSGGSIEPAEIFPRLRRASIVETDKLLSDDDD